MVCPQCQNNSIPFLKTWAKSGMGTYVCPSCGAVLRVKKSAPLVLGSTCLGLLAAGSALYYRSWKVLIVAAVVALILDAFLDFLFRRLELSKPKA
jgi:hypothetical protein